jgi:hypothetical protein
LPIRWPNSSGEGGHHVIPVFAVVTLGVVPIDVMERTGDQTDGVFSHGGRTA